MKEGDQTCQFVWVCPSFSTKSPPFWGASESQATQDSWSPYLEMILEEGRGRVKQLSVQTSGGCAFQVEGRARTNPAARLACVFLDKQRGWSGWKGADKRESSRARGQRVMGGVRSCKAS